MKLVLMRLLCLVFGHPPSAVIDSRDNGCAMIGGCYTYVFSCWRCGATFEGTECG